MTPRPPMRRVRSAALAVVAAGAAAAPAGPPTDTRPADSAAAPARDTTLPAATLPADTALLDPAAVDAALADLSAADWRVRDRAVARLAAMGPEVEDRVRRLARDTDQDEARDRARVVLQFLAADRRLGPTRVTLRLRNVTPQAAFAELSRQGGLFVRARRESLWAERDAGPLSFDLVDRPFWEAAQVVCARTGLRPLFEGDERGGPLQMVLVPDATGEMANPRAATTGPVTVLLDSLTWRPADAGPAHGGRDGEAELRLAFFADPRWRVADYPWTGTVTRAADAAGRLLPTPQPLALQPFRDGSPRWAMRAVLPRVPAGTRRLATLAGSVRLTLAELSPPAVIPDVLRASGVVSRTGPHSLVLDKVGRAGRRYVARAIFTPGPAPGLPPPTPEALTEAVWLVDEAGRPLRRADVETAEEGGQIRLTATYEAASDAAPPARLVWRMPVGTREVTVPFAFTDLPVAE